MEIMRCLQSDNSTRTFEKLLNRALNENNFSYHAVTGIKYVAAYFEKLTERSETTKRLDLP
jgi:nicotinamide riboside kinase